MTTARARSLVLERLASGDTVLLALLLALPERPAWGDGQDAEGRSVLLCGRSALGTGPEAEAVVVGVLEALRGGAVPAGVHAVAYAPAASAAIAAVLDGAGEQYLLDGPRASGKSQALPALWAGLAELHARAEFPLPLRVLLLTDTLASAAMKLGRTLESAVWAPLWSLRDARTTAELIVGGTVMVSVDFVGALDPTGREKLKAEAHTVAVEEALPSLGDSRGVDADAFDLARSSLVGRRLPTRRHVAVVVTNPGDEESWPYARFIDPGAPGCVRCQIPASDRLTPEEIEALAATFAGSPHLAARLARGEWVTAQLGASCTPGFGPAHVAPEPIVIPPAIELVLGQDNVWPCTVVAFRNGPALCIVAALISEEIGTAQHVERVLLPWMARACPWALRHPEWITHVCDPAMEVPSQADGTVSSVTILRKLIGGRIEFGPVSWEERIGPLTALLAQFDGARGRPVVQVDPRATLLIRTLQGRAYYPLDRNGRPMREKQAKPNRPYDDVLDAACYAANGFLRLKKPKPVGWRPAPAKKVQIVNMPGAR